MSILKSTLLIKVLSLILSVLAVFNQPVHSFTDVINSAINGWYLSYTAEERADRISELLLANKNETFESETAELAKEIIYAVIIQFADGNADENAVTSVLENLPRKDIVRDSTKTYEAPINPELLEKITEALPESVRGIVNLLGMGIYDLYIYFDNTDYAGIYEFKGSYVDSEGTVYHVDSGAYYDSKTGVIYGKNNDGIFGIGFDYDAKQYMLQTPTDCWMKNMGFNVGYDILGKLVYMDTNTIRIKFNACGRDWMVQMWKGNYTVLTNGCEIGLYYLEDGKIFNYTCAHDSMALMEMSLTHKDDVLLKRNATKHWWLSAIQIGPAIDYEELTLNGKITFDNPEMTQAFKNALEENNIIPTLDGNTVSFSWT